MPKVHGGILENLEGDNYKIIVDDAFKWLKTYKQILQKNSILIILVIYFFSFILHFLLLFTLLFVNLKKKFIFTKPCRAADILYRSELLQCCLFEISNFTILSFMWFYASHIHVELHRLFTRRFISNHSRVLLGTLLIGFISEMFFCVFYL